MTFVRRQFGQIKNFHEQHYPHKLTYANFPRKFNK